MSVAPPTIGVITCTRDPGPGLASFAARLRGLASWADQVVLVDDGSTDGSSEPLRQLADEFGNVRHVRTAVSSGIARARNLALSMCVADYVWFVDDDDDWPDDVETPLREASTLGADLVQFRAVYCPSPGQPARLVDGVDRDVLIPGERGRTALLSGTIGGFLWSKLIRRESLGEAPFPPIVSHSDVVGVARALSSARQVAFRSAVVYHYVHREGSVSRRREPDWRALEYACHRVVELVGRDARSDDRACFTASFLCRALLRTPVRSRVGGASRRRATAMMQRTWLDLDRNLVRQRDPVLWAVLTVGTRFPRTAHAVHTVLYAALDGGRRLRRVVRVGGRPDRER